MSLRKICPPLAGVRGGMVLALTLLLFILSCNIINPAEPTPTYLEVNEIKLDTTASNQGTESSRFTDVWVTVDGLTQGAYELPAKFPLLFEGQHRVELKAGIMLNGISGTRSSYTVVTTLDTTINLQPAQVITVNPTVTYTSATVFAAMEDFEGNLSMDTILGSDTSFTLIGPPDAFEGTSSGAAYLDDAHPNFILAFKDSVELPTNGRPCYVELNYKCNVEFKGGLVAYTPSGISGQNLDETVKASESWRKIYINLTPIVTNIVYKGTTHWKFYLYAAKDADQSTGYFYFDNIKVLY